MNATAARSLWLAAGKRTPFAKAEGALAQHNAIALSVPVLRAMLAAGAVRPDVLIWGTVIPNLEYSNLAREVLIDAGGDRTIPAFSTVLACSTSMVGVIEAAGLLANGTMQLALVGGVEAMSHVQLGLSARLSQHVRRIEQARGARARLRALAAVRARDVRLYIPRVANRATGRSMGEHCEEMARAWHITRTAQDAIAFASHQRALAAQQRGFFDDLIVPVDGVAHDTLPRAETTAARLAALAPAFDRHSGQGTLTAGNSSPLTDGAAAIWVADEEGLARLPSGTTKVRIVDWELAAIDLFAEGLLMAPSYAIARLLARQRLRLPDITLWEIHEAFAAQVLANIAALEDRTFVTERIGITHELGSFPRERINPNGGSIALGHPFAATGARILSQAAKELAAMASGSYAIVSICADGGQGSVMLLQTP